MIYHLEHTLIKTDVKSYIGNYRDPDKFIEYCKQCNRYTACWACPPYDFDTEQYISPYTNAFILGTKITPDNTLRNNTEEQTKSHAYNLIEEVRKFLDEALLHAERIYPGSKVFFAGTCHLCPIGTCTRITGSPCLYPDKIRPSLEAFGFDIGRTSSELIGIELKWSSNGELPEYFVLVSGLFSDCDDINIPSIKITNPDT